LCNDPLHHAPKGKTVYIPREKAEQGIKEIREIICSQSTIKIILAMSLQVNYWLQLLDFYPADSEFLRLSEPDPVAMSSVEPYYQPKEQRTFLRVYGKKFPVNEFPDISLFPILHVKCYPLNHNFRSYRSGEQEIAQKICDIIEGIE
jgi:hypothetical protein